MAILPVSSVLFPASASSVTSSAINTLGSSILFIVTSSYDTVSAVNDSQGNTYAGLTQANANAVNEVRTRIWYSASPLLSSSHTFSWSGTNRYCNAAAAAFSGSLAAVPFDAESTISTSSEVSSLVATAILPSENNELVLVLSGFSDNATGTASASGSVTLLQGRAFVPGTAEGLYFGYQIQTTATTASPTITLGGGAAQITINLASFKAAAAAGGNATFFAYTRNSLTAGAIS